MTVIDCLDQDVLSQALFEEANDAFLILDPDGSRILDVNPATQRLTGFRKHQCRSMTIRELLDGDATHDLQELIDSYQTTGFFHSREGYYLRKHDGGEIPVNLSVSRIHTRPRPLGLVVARDITERQQLQEQQAQLFHVARLSTMGRMVAELIHEISQPLYSITNYAKACINQLEASDSSDAECIEWLSRIRILASSAGEMRRRLSSFVRPVPLARSSHDLNEIIRQSLSLASFDTRRHHVAISFQPASFQPNVYVDRVQIQQVLMNLLLNAYDSVQGNPQNDRRVIVGATHRGDRVEVYVADNGPGLTAETQDHVFDPFFTTKPDGMGMGLAVSRSIVEEHGGGLWVQSMDERGARFCFTLQATSETARR